MSKEGRSGNELVATSPGHEHPRIAWHWAIHGLQPLKGMPHEHCVCRVPWAAILCSLQGAFLGFRV
jgi:hypothetical protein